MNFLHVLQLCTLPIKPSTSRVDHMVPLFVQNTLQAVGARFLRPGFFPGSSIKVCSNAVLSNDNPMMDSPSTLASCSELWPNPLLSVETWIMNASKVQGWQPQKPQQFSLIKNGLYYTESKNSFVSCNVNLGQMTSNLWNCRETPTLRLDHQFFAFGISCRFFCRANLLDPSANPKDSQESMITKATSVCRPLQLSD